LDHLRIISFHVKKIYDFQTFLFTWSSANEQIEYAYYKSHEPLPKEEMMELRQLGSVSPIVIQDFMKVFFIFDTDKNGTISLSEARKGIAYLAIDEAVNVPPQSAIDSLFQSCLQRRSERGVWTEHEQKNQLRFPDFLYMLLSLKLR
jgi:Ca2+-binding EF-hand superfamily protein